ncbi:aerobic-type carbon monoxide dehydrogenase%2C CoxM_3 [Mycobacterium tuberculosis]|nr:aerobic-type carbon monoxide dehydrogenase%2C CoxM_3 [Mycobacterium tuberculosis]
MKPAELIYLRAGTRAEALAMLADAGQDARLLAGGQSLVPMLNLRIARPSHLVDIGRLTELNRLGLVDGELYIGALVRHHVLAEHPLVTRTVPLLAEAARHVGHPAIRHRGTLAGSLAHADPSGELLAAAMLLDATLLVESRSAGTREVPAREFVLGPYETVLEPDEMITWLRVPPGGGRTGFYEVVRRSGDFALAGAAVRLPDGDGEPAVAVAFGSGGYQVAGARLPDGPDTAAGTLAALLQDDGEHGRLRRTAIERAVQAARGRGGARGHG